MSYVTPQSCFWTIRSLFVSAKHLQKIFEKFMCPFRFIYTHLLIQVVFNTNSDLNNICEFNSSSLFQCNMGEVLQQMSGYMNFNDHLHSISPPPTPPLSAGGQPSIQNFKKGGGSGKKWVPGGSWRVSATDICQGEFIFFVKKSLYKMKFSNVNLGLLYPNNQLMFGFATFWFC